MLALVIFGWLALGFISNYLLWLNNQYMLRLEELCPSPKAIFICLLLSAFMPPSLILVVIMWGAHWIDRRPEIVSWWTRPICDFRRKL